MRSMSDPFDNPQVRRWLKRAEREMLPKLRESALSLMLFHEGHVDMKIAVELGSAILLDKPIVVITGPNDKIPPVLLAIARKVIRANVNTSEGKEAISREIAKFLDELT